MHNAPGPYIANMLQEHMSNAQCSRSMSKYAPGAVYVQIMLLEHIELRILTQIIHALGACSWSSCSWSIISGQNLTEADVTVLNLCFCDDVTVPILERIGSFHEKLIITG